MIAVDCQPVSIVDHECFKSLVSTLEPKYQIPSRKYFSETVILIYCSKNKGKYCITIAEGCGVTTDAWSSDVNGDALQGLD